MIFCCFTFMIATVQSARRVNSLQPHTQTIYMCIFSLMLDMVSTRQTTTTTTINEEDDEMTSTGESKLQPYNKIRGATPRKILLYTISTRQSDWNHFQIAQQMTAMDSFFFVFCFLHRCGLSDCRAAQPRRSQVTSVHCLFAFL